MYEANHTFFFVFLSICSHSIIIYSLFVPLCPHSTLRVLSFNSLFGLILVYFACMPFSCAELCEGHTKFFVFLSATRAIWLKSAKVSVSVWEWLLYASVVFACIVLWIKVAVNCIFLHTDVCYFHCVSSLFFFIFFVCVQLWLLLNRLSTTWNEVEWIWGRN